MKSFWNFIYKYRLVIVIIILLSFLGIGYLIIKPYIGLANGSTIYGTRLSGIENVPIDTSKKEEVIALIKSNSDIVSVNIDLQGKIVNIKVIAKTEKNTKEEMQKLCTSAITKFTEEQIRFYDFQIFVKNEDAKYNMIGYKNNDNEDISWVYDEIVSEVIDEKTEE